MRIKHLLVYTMFLVSNCVFAQDSFVGKVEFDKADIEVGEPINANILLKVKGEEYTIEQEKLKSLLTDYEDNNLKIFLVKEIKQDTNNFDVAHVSIDLVFTNPKLPADHLIIKNPQAEIILEMPSLKVSPIEKSTGPIFFIINLPNTYLKELILISTVLVLFLSFLMFRKMRRKKKIVEEVVFNSSIDEKRDVEKLYVYLRNNGLENNLEVKKIILEIEKVQYKKEISREEIEVIKKMFLEKFKENGQFRI